MIVRVSGFLSGDELLSVPPGYHMLVPGLVQPSKVSGSTSSGNTLLVNGDLPGPTFIADPLGQPIVVPLS